MANTFQGHFPDQDSHERRLGRPRAGGEVSAEPLRPPRHRRQRLGVVQRLVSPGLRTRSSRRAGASRTIPTVRPTASTRGAALPQARSARRLVPLHQPVLRALSRRLARPRRALVRRRPRRIPLRAALGGQGSRERLRGLTRPRFRRGCWYVRPPPVGRRIGVREASGDDHLTRWESSTTTAAPAQRTARTAAARRPTAPPSGRTCSSCSPTTSATTPCTRSAIR